MDGLEEEEEWAARPDGVVAALEGRESCVCARERPRGIERGEGRQRQRKAGEEEDRVG